MLKNYPKNKLQRFIQDIQNHPTNDECEGMGLYVYMFSVIIEPFPNAFDWGDKNFTDYCNANGITQKGNSSIKKQHNHFWFNANNSNSGKAYGFLNHIRNAFAHGRINIVKFGKERYYVLSDQRVNKNHKIEQTMSGHIQCEYLWDMIELLLKTRKP